MAFESLVIIIIGALGLIYAKHFVDRWRYHVNYGEVFELGRHEGIIQAKQMFEVMHKKLEVEVTEDRDRYIMSVIDKRYRR